MIEFSRSKGRYPSLLDTLIENESEEVKRKILQIVQETGIEPDDPSFLQMIVLTHARVVIAPLSDFLAKREATLLAIQRQIESDSKNFQNQANQFLQASEQLQNTLKMTTFGSGQMAQFQRPGVVPTQNTSFRSLLQAALLGATIATILTSLLFTYMLRQGGFRPQKHSNSANTSFLNAHLPQTKEETSCIF